MFALIDIFWFLAGGALVWFSKDKLVSLYKSAEDQIGILEDQIRALKARL